MNEINSLIINNEVSIPLAELTFQFSTSGGPGGQHANRSATKVTLLFDIRRSPSLDDQARQRLLDNLANKVDKNGVLHLQAQDTRSQKQNRELAISRLIALLSEALAEPKQRKKVKPSAKAHKKRLKEKKKQSQLKQERGQDWLDDL